VPEFEGDIVLAFVLLLVLGIEPVDYNADERT
jgi:hypothetical protein